MAAKQPDQSAAPVLYQHAQWPTELQNPRDVLGQDSLTADMRAKLATTETPFVITAAEEFYWPDGKPALKLSIIIAPDDAHDTPWRATLNLGLPASDPAAERLSDRERILAFFTDHPDARPVGPFVAVLVPTSYAQPYFALRAASDAVMARHALNITQLRADRGA